jgi:hypothetical protein
MRRSLALLALLLLLPFGRAGADDPWVRLGAAGQAEVQLYFFWSASCPHCLEARPYVEALGRERPWVRVHSLEVTRNPEHARLFERLAAGAGGDAASVPALAFCGEMLVGWESDATTGAALRARLDLCRARVLAGRSPAAPEPAARDVAPVAVPLLGEVDPRALSLPVLTLVLAGLDAFNPCAFFVLLFLLSLLVHQRSRGRMLAIGGAFVLVSGLMYFAFMAAWLNVFQLLGSLQWVTLGAGLLAIVVGIVNVKDFFALGQGVTLSIPESRKPDIYRRSRAILEAGGVPAMLLATIALAVAVNFYELLCTAGFPMVYTRLLTLHDLPAMGRYLYLALYNVIYILPLLAIVLAFVYTMGARKLTEREGRLLKLMSGLMMLGLGALLAIAPDKLNNLAVALALVAVAVGLTWVAARVTRRRGAA